MIKTKAELRSCLNKEREIYLPHRNKLEIILESENRYKIYKYIKLLRKTEYHYNNKKNLFHKLMYANHRFLTSPARNNDLRHFALCVGVICFCVSSLLQVYKTVQESKKLIP